MFHKVKTVLPCGNLKLRVHFAEGTTKQYDVMPLLRKWESFCALQTVPGLFEQVRIDTGGYGIIWNDELDLSCDELWENGISQV